jgi:hypothetical protein
MANPRARHLFLGIVLAIVGTLLGLAVAVNLLALFVSGKSNLDPWFFGGLATFAAMAAFCGWVASNEFQRANGKEIKKAKFRWGRLLAGVWLVFWALHSHFHPAPGSLKADNAAQAAGMLTATVVFVCIGVALIGSSFQPRRPESGPELESNATQGPGT